MLDVDATAIKKQAEALRRKTRDNDVILLCDLILASREAAMQETCSTCQGRRQAKADAMKRYRAKKRATPGPEMGDFADE